MRWKRFCVALISNRVFFTLTKNIGCQILVVNWVSVELTRCYFITLWKEGFLITQLVLLLGWQCFFVCLQNLLNRLLISKLWFYWDYKLTCYWWLHKHGCCSSYFALRSIHVEGHHSRSEDRKSIKSVIFVCLFFNF